ncbi:MAG: hypothetical protein U1F34_04690 [Gammaproteobacteria bacterium]
MTTSSATLLSNTELRREINALHGLLHFSLERRYPDGVTSQLKTMLRDLEGSLTAAEDGSEPSKSQ